MNCLQFRQLKLADPYSKVEEAHLHQAGCSSCTRFEHELQELDNSVRKALTIAVPEGFAAKVLLNQSLQSHPRRPTRWYWLSLAASFFFAVSVFQFSPADTLDDEIIAHLDFEAHQVHGKFGDISDGEVQNVLSVVGGDINHSLGEVTYASKCLMDGMLVAHFVVSNGGQPYTLILIPQEIDDDMLFQSENWNGMIVQHPTGSLAIVARSSQEATNLSRLARHYGASIRRTTI